MTKTLLEQTHHLLATHEAREGKYTVNVDDRTRAAICPLGVTVMQYDDNGICVGCVVNEQVVVI
jgi:hypothetical protein